MTTMTRGPDKQFDPDEALEKAMALFWAKGYAATGMAELQEQMGIGRKSLYDTFEQGRFTAWECPSLAPNASGATFDA
jgi:AcrR family transcriptional regulator